MNATDAEYLGYEKKSQSMSEEDAKKLGYTDAGDCNCDCCRVYRREGFIDRMCMCQCCAKNKKSQSESDPAGPPAPRPPPPSPDDHPPYLPIPTP